MQTKVIIGSDHAGFAYKKLLKEYLIEQNYIVEDVGTDSDQSCHYPQYSEQLALKVLENTQTNLGILICGSGIGVSIAANKIKGIRCSPCHDHYTAFNAKSKENCNVISIGQRIVGPEIAKQIVDVFLKTEQINNQQLLAQIKIIEQNS